MPFNTFSVAAATTPTVIATALAHYLDRNSLKGTPRSSLSYHEGVELIKKFMEYASNHTVEQFQAFTSQYVPHPISVHVEITTIPLECLDKSAQHVIDQLGPDGVEKVGGKAWWRWRPKELSAEWIEMRKDYWHRTRHPERPPRTMLYVHGGAYFFGSVDEHRYQLQRHARKLQARVFAPRYRLAPQFPFPCGLYDVLACYLYLISQQPPGTIVLAGDSAGGGMILSMMIILRDQGVPLPAGAVLISPWVDLCHSFPSLVQENKHDFIPPHGFLQKPSLAWPPPTMDDIEAAKLGITLSNPTSPPVGFEMVSEQIVDPKVPVKPSRRNTSIAIDGKTIILKDQIQMYTTNDLMSHPLVSPILQGSLGGLPPLLVLTGGGEVLRDEQIYLAHKAANPATYPTWEGHLADDQTGRQKASVDKWPPTKVWLQIYDDCCHVTPTLSFTRPAKFMYRAIAHFGAWALTNATHTKIEVVEDDDISIISSSDSANFDESEDDNSTTEPTGHKLQQRGTIRDADSTNVPPFEKNMIRQQIDRHGRIFDLPPPSEFLALQMKPEEIGVIKETPVRRWMAAKEKWDTKFAAAKKEVQRRRAKELASEFVGTGEGERPPPSAAAGRIRKDDVLVESEKKKPSLGLKWWSSMGYSHDEKTMAREKKAMGGQNDSNTEMTKDSGEAVVSET
ncbi:uncharacterized protein LAJ45_06846 [Morchella importuna]|uniref:uncharacterized protein n=1 Tax=Morchella importuna TaxID=1174673 RepID=UPI001E8E2D76|nr:uncharacterized protein LAJ45_06846 [Morchella importuna]KAH8149306.1 hypothetical protein LAJ45_06846 [Morchella importuna]